MSEKSVEMYNDVLDAREKSKELDETLKDMTRKVQALKKEKEAAEKRRGEALKKETELEFDVRDLRGKIAAITRDKVYFVYQNAALLY